MFDIGFPELLVILLVALLAVGPERLPEAVRTASLWIGRLRRSFLKLRQELETEIGAEDLKRQLLEDQAVQEAKQAGRDLQETAKELQGTGRELDRETQKFESKQ